jgi:hypothetical protein
MMTLGPGTAGPVARFGKELVHPRYDYVPLEPRFAATLADDRWLGYKLVSYAVPGQPARVVNRLYLDAEPFDAHGRPRNRWRLLSEYVDVDGVATGQYDRVVDWGGWQTTLRVDGVESIDVAVYSLRPIRLIEGKAQPEAE